MLAVVAVFTSHNDHLILHFKTNSRAYLPQANNGPGVSMFLPHRGSSLQQLSIMMCVAQSEVIHIRQGRVGASLQKCK